MTRALITGNQAATTGDPQIAQIFTDCFLICVHLCNLRVKNKDGHP